MKALNIVIFGLSITSSWGNGHATTYRSLIKALAQRGHKVTFFEKDVPWYRQHRDLPNPSFCETILYHSIVEIEDYRLTLAKADLIILGSYVADAEVLANRVRALSSGCFAFYDIDTPVTLAKLQRGDYEYLTPAMIPLFDLYLSFSGGPVLKILEERWGAQRARALHCSVDPDLYYPATDEQPGYDYALGYLGTYSEDRQPTLNKFLLEPAITEREMAFCVAGAQYPLTIYWPDNVIYIEHIPPHQHRLFYQSQRFTLNITRKDMIEAGHSPSVRLFEAAACGTPIITDEWSGLENYFTPGKEILVARTCRDVLDYLQMPAVERTAVARRAQQKVLRFHTAAHRAAELEHYWEETFTPLLAQAL